MPYKKLYIIGNGFDLHHCVKSKYSNFQQWLKDNEEKYNANYIIHNFFPVNAEFWKDFENSLSSFEIMEFAENAASENYPNLSSDHYARELDMAFYQSEQDFIRLVEEIKLAFHDWICSLNKPMESRKIYISKKDAYFINFNYTKTLERLYNIPSKNILHIHGCVDEDDDLIFGHGEIVKEPDIELPIDCDTPDKIQEYYENNYDFVMQNVISTIVNGVNKYLRKDVEGTIEKHSFEFFQLNQIEEIHIYGWSFSKIDTPYLDVILAQNKINQIKWTVSWLNDTDIENTKRYLTAHGVEETNIRFINLEELIDKSQLTLFNMVKPTTQQRVVEIIQKLENYSVYTNDLYQELSYKLYYLPHNMENSFYNFFYCLDWRAFYDIDKRLTLYDIYYITGKKSFYKSYKPLKQMALDGDIENISRTYQDILGNIKIGLSKYGVNKDSVKKGLYEFIQDFINKLVSVDYRITDFDKSDYLPQTIIDRFEIDIYYKFIKAYKIAKWFNKDIKCRLETTKLEISNSCFLHILLRHYTPLKVFTNYHHNPIYHNKIKNGIGKLVCITAFDDATGGHKVISQDGIFVSTKGDRCENFLCDDILMIVNVMKHVLPILSSNINPNRSPNIIFYNNELYGVEFHKYAYKTIGKIVVESIYPINSKWQKQYGISQEDYNHIINRQDIPQSFNIKIEQ